MRVSLYEDGSGLLTIHLNGQPLAFRLRSVAGRAFASDAATLAATSAMSDAWDHAAGDVVDLSMLPDRTWPHRTGRLVAWWEDGYVTGLLIHGGADAQEAVEPTGRARLYIGPPGMRTPQ